MILLALLLLATVSLMALLTRTIRADGLGHRRPPRSHLGEDVPLPRAHR